MEEYFAVKDNQRYYILQRKSQLVKACWLVINVITVFIVVYIAKKILIRRI